MYVNRFLQDGNTNPVVDAVEATSGTIAVSQCRQANVQWAAGATSSAYRLAVMAVTGAAGTCSRANCAAVLSNLGTYECMKSGDDYWMAWRVYNASAAITGNVGDKLVIERLG